MGNERRLSLFSWDKSHNGRLVPSRHKVTKVVIHSVRLQELKEPILYSTRAFSLDIFPKWNDIMRLKAVSFDGGGRFILARVPWPRIKKKATVGFGCCKPTEIDWQLTPLYGVTSLSGRHVSHVIFSRPKEIIPFCILTLSFVALSNISPLYILLSPIFCNPFI